MSTKRILSLVLALVMVLGTFSTMVFAETNNEKVKWLQEQGIVQGDEKNQLNLDKTIDRASVAKLVVEALDLGSVAEGMKGYKTSFSDVPVTHWANGYINVVSARGIMIGNAGKFMPGNQISYAEVLTILVRIMDGLTADEEKAAVWPTTYIAKAHELGILEDVTVVSYQEAAIRERIFEMFYNAMTNMEVGNYTVVTGLVLENYRVEALAKDEIVVELIKDAQRADYAKLSRVEKGDQLPLTIPTGIKNGDVEHLLGKVANFTLNKDGKVVKVEIDNSYKYETGYISATGTRITLNDDVTYTVSKDERYSSRGDERIFSSYFNNRPMAYADFAADKAASKAEFARLTIKNGKVLFVDAFQFDDVAPVQEVKNDGKVVYIYDDVRNGAIRKLEFSSRTKVVVIDGIEMKAGSLEDISEMNVIHYVDNANTVFVRQDSKVEGVYEKFTTVKIDQQPTVRIFVDDEGYTAGFGQRRKAVFSVDGENFVTLEENGVSQNLEKIRKQEVTVLLDMNDRVQFIAAGIKDPTFIGLFEQTNKGDARFIKADNEKEVYSSTFDTRYINLAGTTKLQSLFDLNVGDLVKVKAVESDIATLQLLKTRSEMVTNSNNVVSMVSDRITIEGDVTYYVEPSTKVFVNVRNPITGAYTLRGISVVDLRRNYTINQSTNGDWNSKVFVYTEPNTKNAQVADVLVFTDIKVVKPITDDYVRKVVLIEGHDAYNYYMVLEDTAGARTTHYVDKEDAEGIRAGDIITVRLTRDDDKDIYEIVNTLIKWNEDVFKIVNISGRTYTLEDKAGLKQTRYLLGAASVFGEPGVDEYVSVPAGGKTGDAISVMVEKTAYAGWHASAPLGVWEKAPVTDTGVVTYINETRIFIDGERYAMDEDTVLFDTDGRTILLVGGEEIANGKTGVTGLKQDDKVTGIKVVNGVVTELTLVETAEDANLADQAEALRVYNLLGGFNNPGGINAGNLTAQKALVVAAREAYDDLTPNQVAEFELLNVVVGDDRVVKLVGAEKKIADLELLASIPADRKFDVSGSSIEDKDDLEFRVALIKDVDTGFARKFNINNLDKAFSTYEIEDLVDKLFIDYAGSTTPMSREDIHARVRQITVNTSALRVVEGHLIVEGNVMNAGDVEFLKAGATGAYNMSFYDANDTDSNKAKLGRIENQLDGTTTLGN